MWKIVLCFMLMGLATNYGMVSYEGYKVFKVSPVTEKEFITLELLQTFRSKFIYWKEPRWVNKEVFVMVSREKLQEFHDIMSSYTNTTYKIRFDNVQTLIDMTMPRSNFQGYNFKSYLTLEQIYAYMDELARLNFKLKVVVGGRTYENREIKGIKIINDANKPGIFIGGGMYGLEWISPATILYILNQLIYSNNSDVRYIADNHNWFIFPIFNPDGYVFTFNMTHGDRLWKKTRKPFNSNCIGADPNKNWNFQWNTSGVDNDPCSELYPGNKSFSEIEMKTISQYMRLNSRKFDKYISFYGYGQQLKFPYAYTSKHISNYDELKRIGRKALQSLRERYNTVYWLGSIGDYYGNSIVSGTSEDYVTVVMDKSIVYQYVLRDEGDYGYLLPPDQIIPTGKETLDSLITLLNETMIH